MVGEDFGALRARVGVIDGCERCHGCLYERGRRFVGTSPDRNDTVYAHLSGWGARARSDL